ncbi:Protein STE50 [Sphaceloma murrayae]|uniref:Protein STE50 n=1 Tax=Sphaceloma murrayae TaxID=2082308 RepID=A0A2K1QV48_9PEZI|nr:Protein STE50 [Sphaceloma murrayae]
MAYKSTYTADSDADDEFERPEFVNPVAQDLSPSESEDMTSPEHTPTTFTRSQSGGSHASPTTLITDWSSAQCAEYMKSLGLGQYADRVIDEAITGEALIEMQHQDLKDMGVISVGHRLTVLKGVYEIKVKQNIPLDQDSYVPLSAEAANNEMAATQGDIVRVIDSIRLRDKRIIEAENQLVGMKEDLNRLIEENRKLREETLPLIRKAKDWSHPLPNPEQPMTTPPADFKPATTTGLSRKFSTKRLFLGNAPKNPSPTVAGTTLQDGMSLDPSAAAMAASNHLTASMISQSSPNTTQQLSPTSPAYSMAPPSRHFPRSNTESSSTTRNDDNYTHYAPTRDTQATLTAPSLHNSTLTTSSALTPGSEAPPSSRRTKPDASREENSNIEIFKSFRVSIEDPCHKVLPVALKRYNINDDWRQYALYIVHGDQERCLGLEEKPLMLFKQLDREGRKPMFMLRKHASPAGEGWTNAGGAAQGVVGGEGGRGLPGGVL